MDNMWVALVAGYSIMFFVVITSFIAYLCLCLPSRLDVRIPDRSKYMLTEMPNSGIEMGAAGRELAPADFPRAGGA